ncbi:MAG: ABC transporter permease [Candidatus Methanomethylicaceae archaeon]
MKSLMKIINFLKSFKLFTFGITILLIFLVLGFIISPLAPVDPRRWGRVPKDLPPSLKYPFGTTTLGQDLFWLITRAIKNSLILSFVTASISVVIAMIIGFLSGHFSNTLLGNIINLINDSFSVIPGLPVLLIFSFAFREKLNIILIGLILCIFGWAWPAKQLRSIILDLKERTHVYTALSSGLSIPKIFLREYSPYILPWIMMQFLGLMNWSIGMETTLGSFGLSTMEEATIGSTIFWVLQYQALLRGIWWWFTIPIITVALLILSIYFISISLGEYLNPQLRIKRIQR